MLSKGMLRSGNMIMLVCIQTFLGIVQLKSIAFELLKNVMINLKILFQRTFLLLGSGDIL